MANGFFLGGMAEGISDVRAGRRADRELGLRERALDMDAQQAEAAQQQQLVEQGEERISSTLEVVNQTIDAGLEAGRTPEQIAQAVEPLVQDAAEIAEGIGRDPTRIVNQVRARLSGPDVGERTTAEARAEATGDAAAAEARADQLGLEGERREAFIQEQVAPTGPLETIDDPTSPTGERRVTRAEAAGQPAPAQQPLVSITNMGEEAMARELGKLDAQKLIEVEDRAQTAIETQREVLRMREAIESGRFRTGVFSDTRQFLSQLAEFVGVNPADAGIPGLGDPATADTLDAASNRLAVEAAQKLGRITNMSLQFIRDSLPNLTRTPEGNRILLETMERVAGREVEMAGLAEEYMQRFGSLRPPDRKSYFQAVRDLEAEDPVIGEELRRRIRQGSQEAPESWEQVFGEGDLGDDTPTGDEPVVRTQQEWESLSPGALYRDPEGNLRRKQANGNTQRDERVQPGERLPLPQ